MTELQKVLYDYAWEYQIPGLLRASQKEAADNDRMVEAALTRLRGLGPEGADLAQRLESGQLTRQAIQGEAVFLAGLSLGLELGAAPPPGAAGGGVCRAPAPGPLLGPGGVRSYRGSSLTPSSRQRTVFPT